jgi:hypothetical protein
MIDLDELEFQIEDEGSISPAKARSLIALARAGIRLADAAEDMELIEVLDSDAFHKALAAFREAQGEVKP